MYRSQPFIKQISRLSSRKSILSITRPSSTTTPRTLFLTRASSSTTGSNSSFDDYDSIMRTKSCNATSSNYSSSSDIDNSLSTSASTSDDDISYASSDKICTSQISYCPNTIDTHETATSKEDYDRYELHHRPCEKTQVSYYDTSWGLGLGW